MHSDMAEMRSAVSNHFPGGACAMCRKKSRRCDRSIPVCGRCTEKGLECGGYPQKFRFCGIASRGKWKNRGTPTEDLTAPSPDVLWPLEKSQVKHVPLTSKGQMKADQNIFARKREGLQVNQGRVQSPPRLISKEKWDIDKILASEQAETLLSHWHLKADRHLHEAVAVDYRVKAFTALGAYIKKASSGTLDHSERDGVFATIQIFLLHDRLSADQERTVFFLGNLAWLDIIRAFSAPERLSLTQDHRQRLLSLVGLKFEAVNGCPREIVLIIGEVLQGAKSQASSQLGMEQYLYTLRESIRRLYLWDSSNCTYPDDNSLWLSVAECFRHACVLRALRLLNVTESAEEPQIQNSVTAILNAVATIPGNSPLIELMVLPLFMAGADCLSPHSRHYILLRLAEIKVRSEMNNTVPKQLLEKVWEKRRQQPRHNRKNVPWMDFTYDDGLQHQHDFLII
ncbi:fungal-specific transcription factor domain-containing protein [Penicillium soppii]|uniref:fungal-specific transcription factor domain-containing protein n=1 Tax=Penicillium soppii TaxID=69789 RepID=UPI0025469AA3|nr:fungal-specific transcription factor domain-containing protein [Penicillium soppii]KAJ5882348.1 fungal-specific transcription factor domain-containing protein [Penicillium soppii]